jgi:hypothetical protein
MRRAWKRVAERGDQTAFAPGEVCDAMVLALEADLRNEVPEHFLAQLLSCFRSRESSLFAPVGSEDLALLAASAGSGFGKSICEFAVYLAESGQVGDAAAEGAIKHALDDRAARCIKSVEEHYLRESSTRRATRVRGRLEEAVNLSGHECLRLARRLLGLESSPRPVLKKTGLDDGVTLP